MDWYDMVDEDCPYEVEWSPQGGLNLRARFKDEQFWRYCECEKAKYALGLAEGLLERGKNEKTYSLHPYHYFDIDG